jgi:RND family efflux transporter MFP subunit
MLPFRRTVGSKSRPHILQAVAALGAIVGFFCTLTIAHGHEGHDHGPPRPVVSAAHPRVSISSDLYELVGIAKGDRLVIYLDRLETNEHVSDAAIAVTIGDKGAAINAEPAADGSYTVPWPGGGGVIELVFAITASSGDDLLIGQLAMPATAQLAPPSSPSGSVAWWQQLNALIPAPLRNPAMLTLAAFGLGLLLGYLLRERRFAPAFATAVAAGIVVVILVGSAFGDEGPDRGNAVAPSSSAGPLSDAPRRLPDGTVFVAKPTQRLLDVRTVPAKSETLRRAVNLIGRVIADPNRTGLVQSINGGRVSAVEGGLPHIGQVVKKGDVLAQVEPIVPQADRTTIAEKAGEIEQLIAVAEARLQRIRQLVLKNAAPQSQVIDAETELEGLNRRRDVIRQLRAEPEVLRAPVDGVVAAVRIVPGQVVQAQDIMFQIVDPKSIWVEALVYGETDPASLDEASVERRDGSPVRLTFRGFSPALQQQARIVHFAMVDPPSDLGIGQPVTVVAKSGAPVTGIAMARDAVVRSPNGESIVWRHIEPERFEARPIRVEPLDGRHVLVVAGLEEGERIIVRGADLVNQIR